MGPKTLVLNAIEAGANNIHDIAKATGLREEMVQAVLEALKAQGQLAAHHEAAACVSGMECGGCPVNNSCGSKTMLTLQPKPR